MTASSQPFYLAGPTAVGKTQLAIELAQRLNAEIVTADSMQVYQGMDIGTAKPTLSERKNTPHHLLDVVTVRDSFDVHQYVAAARKTTQEIEERGCVPLFSGGTGFYLKAFIEGIDPLPTSNSALRSEIANAPLHDLLEELKHADPEHYQQIDRQNPRRVHRAIEIIRLTGQPVSIQRRAWNQRANSRGPKILVLSRTPEELRQRINDRVDQMMASGLVEETQRLIKEGLAENTTARQALGYRQVLDHLHEQVPLDEAIARIKTKTWQFARRQLTWFRKQPNTIWINLSELPETQHHDAVYNTFRSSLETTASEGEGD